MRALFETQWYRNFYAKHWGKLWLLQVLLLLAIGFGFAWTVRGTSSEGEELSVEKSHAEHAETAKVWTCSMHPEIVKDEPRTCDICGMPSVRVETLGYVHAEPTDESKPLVIPVTAALVTGTRAIVYVEIPTEEEPTFEGREVVLGPRAGDYYLVRNGLKEGELVVTNGNFKLDSALQISAKPSMMTPEGGGGSGHDHGGGKPSAPGGTEDHQMPLPAPFRSQLEALVEAFDDVTDAVEQADLVKIRTAFDAFGQSVEGVEGDLLVGHPNMQWGEFSMLLSNDAVEGREVATLQDADRVYLELTRHTQQVRKQFGMIQETQDPDVVQLNVTAEFQTQLARLWTAYLPVQQALAADDFQVARQGVAGLQAALAGIQAGMLEDDAAAAWKVEQANLQKIITGLARATDITVVRSAFALLSDEMIAIVRSFGLGNAEAIYELHCPMAFEGRGASWLQDDDQARNPYYGATMLRSADRVDLISRQEPLQSMPTPHQGHEH